MFSKNSIYPKQRPLFIDLQDECLPIILDHDDSLKIASIAYGMPTSLDEKNCSYCPLEKRYSFEVDIIVGPTLQMLHSETQAAIGVSCIKKVSKQQKFTVTIFDKDRYNQSMSSLCSESFVKSANNLNPKKPAHTHQRKTISHTSFNKSAIGNERFFPKENNALHSLSNTNDSNSTNFYQSVPLRLPTPEARNKKRKRLTSSISLNNKKPKNNMIEKQLTQIEDNMILDYPYSPTYFQSNKPVQIPETRSAANAAKQSSLRELEADLRILEEIIGLMPKTLKNSGTKDYFLIPSNTGERLQSLSDETKILMGIDCISSNKDSVSDMEVSISAPDMYHNFIETYIEDLDYYNQCYTGTVIAPYEEIRLKNIEMLLGSDAFTPHQDLKMFFEEESPNKLLEEQEHYFLF